MFIMMHGSKSLFAEFFQVLTRFHPKMVPFDSVKHLISQARTPFYNWIIFTLNYSSRFAVLQNVFERTVVAHRRGLSRDGRNILASHGVLMKQISYDKSLKAFLAENVSQQKWVNASCNIVMFLFNISLCKFFFWFKFYFVLSRNNTRCYFVKSF